MKNPQAVALGKRTLKKYGREHYVRIGQLRGRTYRLCESARNPRRSHSHQFRGEICVYCKKTKADTRAGII